MRTIKFRAKGSGCWRYGQYVHTGANPSFPFNRDFTGHILNVDKGGIHFIPITDIETIGQFTGLYDKNGKEIYEGDIIGCHNPNIKHLIFYNEKQGRFMAALNGDIENDFVCVCGLDDSRWIASKEVIGNIYDNPELLKGGKG